MERVKLTPDVDLFENPEAVAAEIKRLELFFSEHNIKWYIQSSFAVRFYGINSRHVTDLDIRVNYPLTELLRLMKPKFRRVSIRPHVEYSEGEFRDECISYPFWKTHVDITSDIITFNRRDNVEYNLPFDKNYQWVGFKGMIIPICSLRYLVAYKLINKRNRTERKDDAGEVAKLLKDF